MDMLRQIKVEYGLSNLTWVIENQLFDSEYGKKRIRIWKDKQLLLWHVNWRDEISKQSGILLDRMIRTKSGEPFFISDKGLVSIHDEIEELFPSHGRETQWGRLIGAMLAYGLKQSDDNLCLKNKELLPLKTISTNIEQLPFLDPLVKQILGRSYYEAKRRSRNAHHLIDGIDQKRHPILNPVMPLTTAKQVFLNLFWVCGDDQPIKGYQPIRKFLEDWYLENGAVSTEKLLEIINQSFSLKKEQGILLLAECLLPYEFERTITDLSLNEKAEDTTEIIEKYFRSWETSRNLVLLLSNWIEKDGEKMVAK